MDLLEPGVEISVWRGGLTGCFGSRAWAVLENPSIRKASTLSASHRQGTDLFFPASGFHVAVASLPQRATNLWVSVVACSSCLPKPWRKRRPLGQGLSAASPGRCVGELTEVFVAVPIPARHGWSCQPRPRVWLRTGRITTLNTQVGHCQLAR